MNEIILAGLDIGSTKVSVVIGVVKPAPNASMNGGAFSNQDIQLEVVGLGSAPSTGIRQGVVVNVEATTEAIAKAREEAELMAGYRISDVYLAVGGTHVKSFDSRGMIAIRNKEVKSDDIARVIEAAKAVAVPSDRQVLHVLPREYKIDEQAGISDPIGMSGVRLEANVHIITAGQTALQNIFKCAEKAGLHVRGLVLQQLASSLAILSEDERKLGVSVVDIGGGTSDIITYVAGAVAHTATVAVGGSHFTQDVAMGLRTPQASAEIVKRKYGCAIADLVDENETIEVEGVGGRKPRSILRRHLCEVIEPRAEETILLIWQEIRRSGLAEQIGSGIVLTGGASQLEGLVEMGEFVCEVPVRKGLPERIGGLADVVKSPECATAVGLLVYGTENLSIQEKQRLAQSGREVDLNSVGETIENVARRVKDFFGGALS
ncbi:MAG: cell division protein FtsA [Bdellovibrionaceae bacterium]|nr:cell division protein FtsA [Pseudobdellovibrionaceae bacterium]